MQYAGQIATMVATNSTMLPLGTQAPHFRLPDPGGKMFALDQFAGSPALIVAFLCNHCPYVKHVRAGLAQLARDYAPRGAACVGISSNDAVQYPADAPAKMAEEARDAGYIFPYLYDETQAVAKAYHAACTPDFFLYDSARRLAYRGAFDQSTPGNGKPVTGELLRAAIELTLAGQPVPEPHRPSMGCSIKWRS